MASRTFKSSFELGDRVLIDGDTALIARVTGLCWKSEDGHTVEVSWMHNGTAQSAWMQPWRLEPKEGAD